MSTLYVGHLNPRMLKRDIEKLFESYGEIKQVHFKGAYAFVDFYDGYQACQCAHNLNGKTVLGERITVEHVHGSAGICYADRDRLPSHGSSPPISSSHRSSANGRSHYSPERERERDRNYKCSSPTFNNKRTSSSSKQRHRESSRERKVYSSSTVRSSSSQKPAWIDKYGLPTRTPFRIVVRNLSRRVSWQDLKDLMREAGEVTYADAHRRSAHEAFVEFISYEDMQKAIKRFDRTNLKGRVIRVSQDRENTHPKSSSDSPQREPRHTRNTRSSSSNRHEGIDEDDVRRSPTKNLKRSHDDSGSISNDRKRRTIEKEKKSSTSKKSTRRQSISSRSSRSFNDNDEYLDNDKIGADDELDESTDRRTFSRSIHDEHQRIHAEAQRDEKKKK